MPAFCPPSFRLYDRTKYSQLTSQPTDYTPKAVSHRLIKICKGGTTHANNGAVNSPTPAATTPKTPRSRGKATPRQKKAVFEEAESYGSQGLMDAEVLLSPTAARGKRGMSGGVKRKVEYKEISDQEDGKGEEVEEEYVSIAKRVNMKPVEDEVAFVDKLVEDGV